jgi:hypothetical protein
VPEANHERAELRRAAIAEWLGVGANLTIGDPSRGLFADGVNLVGRRTEGDAHRGRQSLGIAGLELLQEFDHGLLVFGAELAEPPNDLARVTPISL